MNFLQNLNIKIDKTLLIVFVIFGLVIILKSFLPTEKNDDNVKDSSQESFDVDTMIPAGYMLIPLEFSNAESLASLSGQFSIVDLYATSEKGKRGFKVASAVKLLRAPLNPQQFAVLVKEEDSAKIVAMEGPFFAALKNPHEAAKSSAKKSVGNPLIIHYGE
ncbi:MAG TPA: hypothetical protein VIG33_02885 [Pseudobdellovibrionaceae bacterium]